MTNDLFLIAHKVRGEPAFDIAQRVPCAVCQGTLVKTIGDETGEPCDCGDGFWWIIPTSGHRAYPYYELRLPYTELHDGAYIMLGSVMWEIPLMPPSLPDHYAANDRTLATAAETKQINLRALGLIPAKPPIDRRL